MLRALPLLLLLTTQLAVAQPVTRTEVCAVSIVRAPADVAHVIQTWVRAEARCATHLEVRAVPTAGGLYLLARYPDGRLRERIVPDAQAAGVLIASWTSEDPFAARTPQAPLVAPPPLVVDPFAGAPAPSRAPLDVTKTAAPPESATRWLTFGGLVRTWGSGGYGVGGEVDVVARGPWVIGVGLAAAESDSDPIPYGGYFRATDVRALGYVARTSRLGAWELRLGAGVGAVHSAVDAYLAYEPNGPWLENMWITTEGVFPMAQASLLLSRRVGDAWAVTGGPVVSWLAQKYSMGQQTEFARRDGDLMVLLGLRHAL